MVFRQPENLFRAGVYGYVPHVHFGKGVCRAAPALVFARNDAHAAAAVCNHGDSVRADVLVAGGGAFVFARQVDPKLCHFKRAAACGKFGAVEFVVDNAAACGHPLHVSLSDNAASAAAVAVGDFSRIGNGYGFKAPVGVCADTARSSLVGGEFHRGGVVQHQEGAGLFVFAHVGKQRSDFEAVTDPVGVRGIIDLFDVTHGVFLSWCVVVGVQAAFRVFQAA